MTPNRLKGHSLPREGRVMRLGQFVSEAPGVCACGALSDDVLPSDGARKRWHRQHKDEVRANQQGGD